MKRDFEMMLGVTILVAVFGAVVLSAPGCAAPPTEQSGIVAPQTSNEKAAFALSTATTARKTALSLLSAGKITAEQAKQANSLADSVVAAVDAYTAAGNSANSQTVDAMMAASAALNVYLATAQVKK